MIKKIYPIVLSTLVLTGCEKEDILKRLQNTKEFVYSSAEQLEKDYKPKYNNSLLKKWYNIKDQEILAERELGPNDYENYDFVVPFMGDKWTKTSYVPIIEDLFMKYIGFEEFWPEHKKKHHLEHYTQYIEDFLKQIGRDADTNQDNIVSKEELEKLKNTKFTDS